MPKNDLECESFTVFSIDSLPVYENKYYLQVYLDACVYKTVNKQKTDYLHENVFEDLILQMLYYDRIHISEGINLAKSNSRKVCMICNCWFFNLGFKFQDPVCNGHHDLKLLSVNISNTAIITVKNADYCYIIHNFSKSEAFYLLKNFALENSGYM